MVAAVADLAHGVGFPLMVDVRPGLVIVDSGKDQWESNAHGLGVDFVDLAAQIQAAARALEATSAATLSRFVQLFIDAADVGGVRAFWVAALGYTYDRRDDLDDIHDPRRLNPVLVFQQLDATNTARGRQRNRIHVELSVPSDQIQSRLVSTIAAGGRIVEESGGRWRVADPEGNELVLISVP